MSDVNDTNTHDMTADSSTVVDDAGAIGQAELQRGLIELSSLISSAMSLPELLTQVASAAALAIAAADGAAAVVLNPTTLRPIASGVSDGFIAELEALQYDVLTEGPCITATIEQRPIRSGSLGGDPRWPRFGPRLGRLNVHSALALPMTLPDGTVVGVLNAYARAKDAFDDDAARLGELFSAPAAVAVHNAQLLSHAQIRAAQLQNALESRATIDQAIGILRSRTGATAEEGFARLREISQHENVKLFVIAQRVVDEAVRRARARHIQD
jgi:GAF domain-containing protein